MKPMLDIEPVLNRVWVFFSWAEKITLQGSVGLKKSLSLTQRPAGNTLVSKDWLGGPDILLNTLFSYLHVINTILTLTLEAMLQQPYRAYFPELQDFQQHLGPWRCWLQQPLVSYYLLQAGILCHSQSHGALAWNEHAMDLPPSWLNSPGATVGPLLLVGNFRGGKCKWHLCRWDRFC